MLDSSLALLPGPGGLKPLCTPASRRQESFSVYRAPMPGMNTEAEFVRTRVGPLARAGSSVAKSRRVMSMSSKRAPGVKIHLPLRISVSTK